MASSHRWLWPVVAGFAAVQVAIIFLAANGPFLDEGIYVVSGMRLLEGHGLSDGYAAWFNGSPFLWPVCSGLGYLLAGLEGSRLVALLFSLVTLTAFGKSAEALFGRSAALWGTVAFASNGLLLALAHFAVYDVAALAGLSVSIWLVTRWAALGQTRWLVMAACAFALAVICKYGYALMGAPLLLLMLSVRPAPRTWKDGGLLLGVAGAILATYWLILFGKPWPGSPANYFAFPVLMDRRGIAVHQLYYGFGPLLLAAYGGVVVWRRNRRLAVIACLGALLVWPAFHLITGTFVSAQKHVVAGFLFAYLLAGAGLAELWGSRARWLTVPAFSILLAWGLLQWEWQERSWPDVRPAARYLMEHMRPGEQLVADSSWSFAMYLYPSRLVASPFAVAEPRLLSSDESRSADQATWLVGTGNVGDPAEVAARHGGHRLVLSSSHQVYWLDTQRFRMGTGSSTLNLYRAP